MQHERLEIIRLNPTGDAKRQIICLAGRVSVFRSRAEDELQLYGDVLCGKESAERFSVVLDGGAFIPSQHLFIGFEPEPFAGESRAIRDYLLAHGFSERDIEPQLLAHGLGGLSRAPCGELNPVQQRMLMFVLALSYSDQVLVLNDPFAELAETWRESFAKELAEHSWKNRVVVVVVRLGARPDVWIDNEYVSRIQLEKPREKTIGFGGGDLSSADFVQQLREELKKTAPPASAAAPGAKGPVVRRAEKPTRTLTAVVKPKPLLWQKPVQHALLATAGVLMAVILLSSAGDKTQPPPPPAPPKIAAMPPKSEDGVVRPANGAAPDQAAPATGPLVSVRQDTSVLNQYPPEIKDAVLKAFRDPKSALQNLPSFKPAPKPGPQTVAAPANYEPPPLPQTAPLYEPNTIIRPDTQNEEELETQRQQLRQHFLEAVARARERQLRESGIMPGDPSP